MAVQYRVGSEVDCLCSRCKLELGHVITALVLQNIKKVKCLTCQQEHAYRGALGSGATKKPKANSKSKSLSSKTPGALRASDYERLLGRRSVEEAIPYSPKHCFHEKDLLLHASFGVGIVTAVKDIKKIEVLFQSGPKILLHHIEAS